MPSNNILCIIAKTGFYNFWKKLKCYPSDEYAKSDLKVLFVYLHRIFNNTLFLAIFSFYKIF